MKNFEGKILKVGMVIEIPGYEGRKAVGEIVSLNPSGSATVRTVPFEWSQTCLVAIRRPEKCKVVKEYFDLSKFAKELSEKQIDLEENIQKMIDKELFNLI